MTTTEFCEEHEKYKEPPDNEGGPLSEGELQSLQNPAAEESSSLIGTQAPSTAGQRYYIKVLKARIKELEKVNLELHLALKIAELETENKDLKAVLIARRLLKNIKALDPEFSKAVDKHFWDLA